MKWVKIDKQSPSMPVLPKLRLRPGRGERNSATLISEEDVTRRLHDLDMHLDQVVDADRDNPERIAAFRESVRCRVAGLNRVGGSVVRNVGDSRIRVPRLTFAIAAVGMLALVLVAISLVASRRPFSPADPPIAYLATPPGGNVGETLFWQGRVTMTENGINFDTAPPSDAGGGGISFRRPWPSAPPSVVDGAEGISLVIARSVHSGKGDCVEAINTAGLTKAPLRAVHGIGYCFRTPGGRIGLMRFIDPERGSKSVVEVMASVWN